MVKNVIMDAQCIPESFGKCRVLKDIVIYDEVLDKVVVFVVGEETEESRNLYQSMIDGTNARVKVPFKESSITFIDNPFKEAMISSGDDPHLYSSIECIRAAFRYLRNNNVENVHIPYTDFVIAVFAENVGGMDALCSIVADEMGHVFDYSVDKTKVRHGSAIIPLPPYQYNYKIESKLNFTDGVRVISRFDKNSYVELTKMLRNNELNIQYINDYIETKTASDKVVEINKNPYYGLEFLVFSRPLLTTGTLTKLNDSNKKKEFKDKLLSDGVVDFEGYNVVMTEETYPEHIIEKYPNNPKYTSIAINVEIPGAEPIAIETINRMDREKAIEESYFFMVSFNGIKKALGES